MEYNVLYQSYDFLKTCTLALIINSPVKGLNLYLYSTKEPPRRKTTTSRTPTLPPTDIPIIHPVLHAMMREKRKVNAIAKMLQKEVFTLGFYCECSSHSHCNSGVILVNYAYIIGIRYSRSETTECHCVLLREGRIVVQD